MGEKSPPRERHSGDTSEGEGASQDYNPQDKQTSQSGSPVLKSQRKGQRPWGWQAGTEMAGPDRGSPLSWAEHSPEVDAGGQFPLSCRQPGLGKKKTGIFVRNVDRGQGFGVRTWDRRIPMSKQGLDTAFLHQSCLGGEGPVRTLRKVLKKPYLP